MQGGALRAYAEGGRSFICADEAMQSEESAWGDASSPMRATELESSKSKIINEQARSSLLMDLLDTSFSSASTHAYLTARLFLCCS